jgi:hypothetical protein
MLVLADNGGYVAGAYGIFAGLLVAYVVILGARVARVRRELAAVTAEAREDES